MSEKREDALYQSDERFRALFEGHQDIMLLIEPESGRIINANPAAVRFYGYSHDVLCRMTIQDINQLPADQVKEQRLRAFRKEQSEFVFPHRLANGKIRIVEVHSTRIPFNKQSVLFSIIHDITERIRAKEALIRAKNELEIKVKERTRELEQSEEKYRTLVENANEVIVVAQDGVIKFIGGKTLELTGYLPEELVSRPFLSVVYPDDCDRAMENYSRRIKGEPVPSIAEFRVVTKNGDVRWAQMSAAVITWERGPAVLAMFTNVTESKEAERALRLSQEKYRLVVENASEAIVIAQDGRLKYYNPRLLKLTGYCADELSSKPFLDFIHPEDRKQVAEIYSRRLKGEAAPATYEYRVIIKDGSTRWMRMNATLVTWEDRPATLNIFTDVTEEKALGDRLTEYARRITQVQEEERKRIAYELHDDTAQYLAILKLQLDSLINSGKIQDPEVLEKLMFLEKDAGRAVDDVRRYSHELRPGVLEHLGLRAALEQIAQDINKLNRFRVEVEVEGEEHKLSDEAKLGLFRIAQEAVNNARKHARAGKVSIVLRFSTNWLRMKISDNGVGFNVHGTSSLSRGKGSLGMMSMQERANLIGATFKIASKPGKGTTVTVTLLLQP